MAGFYVRDKYIYYRSRNGMFSGMEVETPGKVHFVVPTTAYDADFTVAMAASWARENNQLVFDSFKLAHDAAVDGRGDVIVLLPGTHTVATASIAMSKTGVRVFGPEAWFGRKVHRPSAVLTTSVTADQIANVTAPDVGFYGVTIQPITASAGIDLSAAANYFQMIDCHFDLNTPAVNTATVGVAALGAATGVLIQGCSALSDGAQGNCIVATALVDSVIRDCVFEHNAGTWASCIITGAGTKGLLIEHCRFDSTGTAMTVGINGTGADQARGVFIRYCDFGNLVTVGVDNYNATMAQINECYKAGVGATDGGTKITAIT